MENHALRLVVADHGPIANGHAVTLLRPVGTFTPHGAEGKQ